MKRKTTKKAEPPRSNLLTNSAFFIALAVVAVSSMLSLRWISSTVHIATGVSPSLDLTYSCIIGTIILILFLYPVLKLEALKELIKENKIAYLGYLLFLISVVISYALAEDKAVTLYSSTGLIITSTLAITVALLVGTKSWRYTLSIIVITSLASSFALKVWSKELYEIDLTWKHYLEHREEFWQAQGKDLEDPTVKLFEARLKSRDNGGFFFHSNIGAAFLATAISAASALLIRRFKRRKESFGYIWLIAQFVLILFILSALIITKSKGAIAALALSWLITAIAWKSRRFIMKHPKKTIAATFILCAVAAISVITYGVKKKELPTLSMKYRWQYWVASVGIIKDHPFGIGAGNFRHYYLQYKLPEAEEEVSSPHNFIIELLCEYGILGATGFTLFLSALVFRILNSAISTSSKEDCKTDIDIQEKEHNRQSHQNKTASNIKDEEKSSPSPVLTLLILLVLIFALLFIINQPGLPGLIYLLAEYLPYMLIFSLAFLICVFRYNSADNIDNSPPEEGERLAILAAVLTFIISNLVSFSLFELPTQILFFTVIGLGISGVYIGCIETKNCSNKSHNKNIRDTEYTITNGKKILLFSIAIFAILAYEYYLLIPIYVLESSYIKAKTLPSAMYPTIYKRLETLQKRYKYDAYIPATLANILLMEAENEPQDKAVDNIEKAASFLCEATSRAKVWRLYVTTANLYLRLAELKDSNKISYLKKAENYLEAAIEKAERAKVLAKLIGTVYFTHASKMQFKDKTLLKKAEYYLKKALTLNAALPKASLYRFSEKELLHIKEMLSKIDTILETN